MKNKEWREQQLTEGERMTKAEEREAEAEIDALIGAGERKRLNSKENHYTAKVNTLKEPERSELIQEAFHSGSIEGSAYRGDDGEHGSFVLDAQVMLRQAAQQDGDAEVLAMFAQLDAETERKRQMPQERYLADMGDYVDDERASSLAEFDYRVMMRPPQYPRALRKRTGSPRCPSCKRWVYHCPCKGEAAEALRVTERDALDAIDRQEVADWQASGGGKRPRRLAKKRTKRHYDPRYDADVPERGSREYVALLMGMFQGTRQDEWRADWRLSDELMAQLEEDAKALATEPKPPRPWKRPKWSKR